MKNSTGGIGFFDCLTLIFIILKLLHVIDWSWLWVLSPLWIGILLAIFIWIVLELKFKFSSSKRDIDDWFNYRK